MVEKVKPFFAEKEEQKEEKEEQEEERASWEVTTSDLSGRQRTETFDSIFVCTG